MSSCAKPDRVGDQQTQAGHTVFTAAGELAGAKAGRQGSPASTTSARAAAREQARAPAARSTGRGRLRLYRRVRRRLGGDLRLRPYLRFSSLMEMPPAALYPAHERLIRSMKSGLWLKEKVSKSRPRRIGTTAATGVPRRVSTQVSLAVFRPYSARGASVISTVFMVDVLPTDRDPSRTLIHTATLTTKPPRILPVPCVGPGPLRL